MERRKHKRRNTSSGKPQGNGNAQAISQDDDDGGVLKLLTISKLLHQQRIENVEKNKGLDANRKLQEKLSLLQNYLKQVEDLNDLLATTVVELEEEAKKRVYQMLQRLESSARTTMEAVINVHLCEQEMRRIVKERLYLEAFIKYNMHRYLKAVTNEVNFLRDQNYNYNHDIKALLQVIHHARTTGHWEMDCVTFCEVTPEQIFGPVQSLSQQYSNESPQSDPSEGDHKQSLNSDFSSQDVSHSSRSSPCPQSDLSDSDADTKVSYAPEDFCSMRAQQEKKIRLLESQISELKHQLTVKEAECESHVWKLEILMQHNENRLPNYSCASPTIDSSMQRCISLPDIGNIYSYKKVLRKSHSCHITDFQSNPPSRPKKKKRTHRKGTSSPKEAFCPNTGEKPLTRLCRNKCLKGDHAYESTLAVHKSHSEPYMFMFADDVYVYRPCEPNKSGSDAALYNDFQSGLPPCQSIDLKFPVDDSNQKICEWDSDKNCVPHAVPDSSSHKVVESSSSFSSNDSLYERNSENILSKVNSSHEHQNMCSSMQSDGRRYHEVTLNSNEENRKNNFGCDKFSEQVSIAVQTENQTSFESIGLQTGMENVDVEEPIIDYYGLGLAQASRKLQHLKAVGIIADNKLEMKEEALKNVEQKLNLSRNECSTLNDKMASLNTKFYKFSKDIEDLKTVNQNLQQMIADKDEKIEELTEEQKVLQNQKRSLMTQLDEQGDLYTNAKEALHILKAKAEEYISQIDLQNQTIQNLQDALVKSKKAADIAFPKSSPSMTNINSNLINEKKNSSKGSIVDI